MARDSGAAGDDGTAGSDAGTDDPEAVARRRDSGTDVHEEETYDAEEPQAEWHVWLAAVVGMIGVGALIAPADVVPELLVGLAPILVVVAAIAGVGQWLYRRNR